MNGDDEPYRYLFTDMFYKECKDIRKTRQFNMDQVKACVHSIIEDPFPRTSEHIHGDFKGWRRAKFPNPERLRVFYVVCHECRENGHMKYNKCSDCATTPDGNKLIIFTGIRDRDKAYRK